MTAENRPFVLEVANDTNMTIKYSKTCVFGESVWVFYEYRLFGDDNIEAIIEHCLLLLQATVGLFYRKVQGEDELPQAEDDCENGNKEEKV